MTTERKIGGHVYRCDKLPADAAMKLFFRLNETFAGDPGVLATIATDHNRGNAIKSLLQASATTDLDGDKVSTLISEAVGLCRVGADHCVVGVKPQSMEDTVEVAWFALGVQFRDFIAAGLAQA